MVDIMYSNAESYLINEKYNFNDERNENTEHWYLPRWTLDYISLWLVGPCSSLLLFKNLIRAQEEMKKEAEKEEEEEILCQFQWEVLISGYLHSVPILHAKQYPQKSQGSQFSYPFHS